MNDYLEKRNERGFTLIELLIAITIAGILTAVAVVGLASATKAGRSSACSTVVESAKAAAATYYANTGAYPRTTGVAPIGFDALTTEQPVVLSLPSDVNHAGNVLSSASAGWSVTISGGGGLTPNGFSKSSGGVACS